MQPQETNYKQLLSEVIKKQIIILGPAITLAKVKNVPGITVTDDGTVIEITGNPQEVTQHLINQFMELSELIVKKTMEPLLQKQIEATPTTPDITTSIPSPTPEPAVSSMQPQAQESHEQVIPVQDQPITTVSVSQTPSVLAQEGTTTPDYLQTQIDQAAQQITSPNPIIEPVQQEVPAVNVLPPSPDTPLPQTQSLEEQVAQQLANQQQTSQTEQVTPTIQTPPEAAVSSTNIPMTQFASTPSTIPSTTEVQQTPAASTNPSQPQQIQEKQQA